MPPTPPEPEPLAHKQIRRHSSSILYHLINLQQFITNPSTVATDKNRMDSAELWTIHGLVQGIKDQYHHLPPFQ